MTTIRARLAEAEATLEAIRTGQVDALVVSGPRGEQTLTIDGASHPYFVLLNAMGDGAALIDRDGAMLFVNKGLGRITGVPPRSLRGASFHRLIVPSQRARFQEFLKAGARKKVRREFLLGADDGPHRPVAIALSPLTIERAPLSARNGHVRMAIVSDLSSRKQAEATHISLLERVISAEDDERRRVARELHDETGQALTALLVGLRSITDEPLARSVRPIALRLRKLAAQTVDEVGRLARGLHPAVLDDTGLATAARRYVRDYARTFGIDVELSARKIDSPKLPPLVAATTYRILQEALTNVARHARAKRVRVALKRGPSWLELFVQDDGVGFDTTTDSAGSRLGLHGMRERATLLGGTIEITARRWHGHGHGHGTSVHARIPLRNQPQPGMSRGRKAASRSSR